MTTKAQGPLKGVKVIEFAGIGPGPFCTMLLSDMGAEVLRIDRRRGQGAGGSGVADAGARFNVTARGRRSLALDLKASEGVATAQALLDKADVLIEGFRPGVMERLGLGPEACHARNPRLVYGRMTGWGQTGPLAKAAGHDINYIALAGPLASMGRPDSPPPPPLNLVGDFGGGALYLAMGICAALFEAARSGKGQTIDCAMTDGVASLSAQFYGMVAAGLWNPQARGANLLDSGAPYYDVYETKDGEHIALGALEPQFYAELRRLAGLEDAGFDSQRDRKDWGRQKAALATIVREKTRDEWVARMEGSDACFAPVLDFVEAPKHPHNKARETFIEADGVVQPNVAPRFSRTPGAVQGPAPSPGQDSRAALKDWGFAADAIEALVEKEVI